MDDRAQMVVCTYFLNSHQKYLFGFGKREFYQIIKFREAYLYLSKSKCELTTKLLPGLEKMEFQVPVKLFIDPNS